MVVNQILFDYVPKYQTAFRLQSSDGSRGILFDAEMINAVHPGPKVIFSGGQIAYRDWAAIRGVSGGHTSMGNDAWQSYLSTYAIGVWGTSDLCNVHIDALPEMLA